MRNGIETFSRVGRVVLLLLFSLISTISFAQQWIGATVDRNDTLADRSIILSKEFRCDKSLDEAQIRICGLGQYELYLDGRKVNRALFAPAWSDYLKTVYYNDITVHSLSKGKHRIDVLLGNGFYHERGLRYHKLKSNYGPLTLWFRMKYGSSTLVSDDTWKWQLSPITYNSLYGGEDCTGQLSFRQMGKYSAVVQTAPQGQMRPQLSLPVEIIKTYPVKRRIKGMTFDMGQNLAGFPEIQVKGRPGQKIKIWVGESLKSDSTVSQKQTGKPYYYVYTIGSKHIETWHPRFSYTGFQYIQIEDAVMQGDENPGHLPVIYQLQSDFISNSAATTGSFSCSNPLFNETYRIIDHAIRSNWQNVWTDCPHREKLGWLEQDWLNGPGLVYNYDARAMIEQTMQVIADAQHTNGSLPEIAPEYITFQGSWAPPFQESPEWGGALIALPFLYAEHYADSSLIQKYLPAMRRYVDYLSTRDSSYILKMGLGDWYDFGPGRAGFAKNTPMPLVSTAHYYRWTSMLSTVDPSYRALADSIKQHYIRAFTPNSQAALAITLDLQLYREGERKALLDKLIADIHSHHDRLTTGDIGTYYLFKVLIAHQQDSLLYKMLNHDEAPGYGAQIRKGMTTLTEQWNPDFGASKNHFMLAHINNHLIQDMVGIHLHGDQVTISPGFIGDITWASGSAMTPKGKVSVDWKIKDGKFRIHIITPDKNKTTINEETIHRICHRCNLELQLSISTE